MKLRTLALISIGAALVGSAPPANSNPLTQCDDAVENYNSAASDLNSYLSRYSRCLQYSEGRDDCSSEFRRLRSAQSDFEYAVSDLQSECD